MTEIPESRRRYVPCRADGLDRNLQVLNEADYKAGVGHKGLEIPCDYEWCADCKPRRENIKRILSILDSNPLDGINVAADFAEEVGPENCGFYGRVPSGHTQPIWLPVTSLSNLSIMSAMFTSAQWHESCRKPIKPLLKGGDRARSRLFRPLQDKCRFFVRKSPVRLTLAHESTTRHGARYDWHENSDANLPSPRLARFS